MQRLLRRIGKLSSKSNRETNSHYGESSPAIIGGDLSGTPVEAKTSPPPPSSSSVGNGTTRKSDEVPSTTPDDERPTFSLVRKKRNSLIESFRKLKRYSRSKDARQSVPGIAKTVPPRVDQEIQPQVVATARESEPVADDQCPSTREVSVNGDETSLSLSVLTLRSLCSAKASDSHTYPRLDAFSEAVENCSGEADHAEFLAIEVPGLVVQTADQDIQCPSTPENVDRNEVLLQFNSISILPTLMPTRHKCELPSPAVLSSKNSVELTSSSVLLTELAFPLSSQLPPRDSMEIEVVERGDVVNNGDDIGDDRNKLVKLHDTYPVDCLFSAVQFGDECPGVDTILSDKGTLSDGINSLALADQEDSSSELGNGKWSLMQELKQLSRHGWYWGPISREEAEEKLTDQPEGAFLIRDSTDECYLFSLSFRSYNRTLHTRIEYCNGEFSFYHLRRSEGYRSLIDLIENAICDSLNGIFCYSRTNVTGSHSFAVKFTKPVSRFTQVRSLQYLCRFVIRQYTRVDHIQKLPLPITVKSWLQKNQY